MKREIIKKGTRGKKKVYNLLTLKERAEKRRERGLLLLILFLNFKSTNKKVKREEKRRKQGKEKVKERVKY